MTGSVILDVIIGLVFVYLLYSLFATIVQEMIATQLSFRAKLLEKAIARMLEDGKLDTGKNWLASRFEAIGWIFSRKNKLNDKFFAASFYNHPLIKYLSEDNIHSKPAYITKENFSKVIIDLLVGIGTTNGNNTITELDSAIRNGRFKDFLTLYKVNDNHPVASAQKAILNGSSTQLDASENTQEAYERAVATASNASSSFLRICPETRLYLQSMWSDAQGDVERFKENLEQWFDDTMERAIGWYKRHTQFMLFCIGFLMAVVFNVDTVQIGKKLARDPKLREQMVQNASNFLEKNKELGEQIEARKQRMDSLYNYPTRIVSAKENDTVSARNGKRQSEMKQIRADSIRYVELSTRTTTLMNEANAMLQNDVNNVNQLLALGWACPFDSTDEHYMANKNAITKISNSAQRDSFKVAVSPTVCMSSNLHGTSLLGWLITALAISLGAPFWFDMLNKLMKLRTATKISNDDSSKTEVTPTGQNNVPVTLNINTNKSGEEAVG